LALGAAIAKNKESGRENARRIRSWSEPKSIYLYISTGRYIQVDVKIDELY
jgi:hypothetical protein